MTVDASPTLSRPGWLPELSLTVAQPSPQDQLTILTGSRKLDLKTVTPSSFVRCDTSSLQLQRKYDEAGHTITVCYTPPYDYRNFSFQGAFAYNFDHILPQLPQRLPPELYKLLCLLYRRHADPNRRFGLLELNLNDRFSSIVVSHVTDLRPKTKYWAQSLQQPYLDTLAHSLPYALPTIIYIAFTAYPEVPDLDDIGPLTAVLGEVLSISL